MARPTPLANRSPAKEPMWPLDLGIAIVGTLVGYTIISQLRFDDPRPLYNAWTYVIGVPGGVVVLSLFTRLVTSRFVERSAQLGFLASVFVHLMLLLMSVNVIVFGRYFPEAFTGAEPKRSVERKTIPEYVFSAPSQQRTTPDWSQPTEAETASKVMPLEQRLVPPLEKTASRLEMPNHELVRPREEQKFLLSRQTPESALPMPADAPGIRSRSLTPPQWEAAPATQPTVPVLEPRLADAPQAVPLERPADPARQQPPEPATLAPPTPEPLPPREAVAPAASMAARAVPSQQNQLPRIGNLGASPQRPPAQQRQRTIDVAGPAPAPLSVAIARPQATAERLLSPTDAPLARVQTSVGASLSLDSQALPAETPRSGVAMSELRASIADTAAGVPSISAGAAAAATSRHTLGPLGLPGQGTAGMSIAGSDLSGAAADIANAPTATAEAVGAGQPADRLTPSESLARNSTRPGAPVNDAFTASGMQLDFNLPLGPGGLADMPAARAGVAVAVEDQPQIGAISLRPRDRQRLDVGGPMQPVGSEIAAVELFRRRVMRTQGSGAATPAGSLGPETEEAIERGLKFLVARQHPDGHWSLQTPDEPVMLRSDTAATGLCLLSFQGAGYTHQQHQYAAVVSSGLRALLAMQRPDGNLYRSEDPVSDQNVMFYSHGIAALALCEAYGMTGDPALREPAQRAVDFIVKSQHQERGGWRYQPQVSSDTSVSGWMMMALKSGELAGLTVPPSTYAGINHWLELAKVSGTQGHLYRYNPFAPDTPTQRHGRDATPSMTAVAMLMRMYSGWRREHPEMQRAADYLAMNPPATGDPRRPQRDTYYWYYATQVMFHMGGEHWENWNQRLKPILVDGQIKAGPLEGSWDPKNPVPDRWSHHAGRLYLTTMNLLSLEVYYRHLPIYEDTAK